MKNISSGFKVINSICILSGHLHLQKKSGKKKDNELKAGEANNLKFVPHKTPLGRLEKKQPKTQVFILVSP